MTVENDVAALQRQVVAIDRQLKLYERWFDMTLGNLTMPGTIAAAQLLVTSTVKVTNLNADQVDGYDLSQALAATDGPTFDHVHVTTNLVSDKNGTTYNVYGFVPLATKLGSTSFDGDAFSTTAKTLIDLSAVFGAPAGIKAILCNIVARDSASAAAASCRVTLGPDDVSGSGLTLYLPGEADDKLRLVSGIVPCDANGDIYYQVVATGAGTLDLWIEIWGYWI